MTAWPRASRSLPSELTQATLEADAACYEYALSPRRFCRLWSANCAWQRGATAPSGCAWCWRWRRLLLGSSSILRMQGWPRGRWERRSSPAWAASRWSTAWLQAGARPRIPSGRLRGSPLWPVARRPTAKPRDDVIGFMYSSGCPPAATAGIGLVLVAFSAALFLRRTKCLARIREFKHQQKG
jgi:hypothetical protein